MSVRDKNDLNKTIVLYPNPAKEFVNLELKSNNEIDPIDIKIFDSNGKEVYKNQGIANQKFKINISSFSIGYYIVKITQGELTQSIKLIKE